MPPPNAHHRGPLAVQIHKGKLYLTDYRAIFFDRHYAPARVMPLLAALRAHPDLPDVDIVVSGNDEPKVPAHPGRGGRQPFSDFPRDHPPLVFPHHIGCLTHRTTTGLSLIHI